MFRAFTVLASALAIVSAHPANFTERDLELESRAPMATVITKCTSAKTIAFTFDDGPYKWNTDIVNLLNKAGAKGTFFVNGANYECIYSNDNVNRLKKAYSGGHQIASHTWSHADMKTLSRTALKNELTKVDTALQRILGVKPAYMRPPYGNYNNLAREVVKENGQTMVLWDFDSGDSVGVKPATSVKNYENLANKKPQNVLTLNHETVQTTVTQVLPKALDAFKKKGYKMVTVAECLGGKNPYLSKGAAQTRDPKTWKC